MTQSKDDKNTIDQEQSPNGRREFLQKAAIAAGAVAATGMATSANAAISEQATATEHKLVHAAFHPEKVTRDNLFRILDEILGRVGCYNCGLNGIDIRLGLNEIIETQVSGAQIHLEQLSQRI